MPNEIAAIPKCFYCGQDKGEVLLATKFNRAMEPLCDMGKLHQRVLDMEPCANCRALMERGIIVIVIDDSKSDRGWHIPRYYDLTPAQRRAGKEPQMIPPNPYRTGHFMVVTEDFIRRVFDGVADQVCRARWTFMDYEAADKIGLIAQAEEMAKTPT